MALVCFTQLNRKRTAVHLDCRTTITKFSNHAVVEVDNWVFRESFQRVSTSTVDRVITQPINSF